MMQPAAPPVVGHQLQNAAIGRGKGLCYNPGRNLSATMRVSMGKLDCRGVSPL